MKAISMIFLGVAFAVTGCVTVTNETRSPATVQKGFYSGEQYEIRTRTIEGRNGPYEHTSVVYRGIARTCIKDSPTDCEMKAELLISEYYDGFF